MFQALFRGVHPSWHGVWAVLETRKDRTVAAGEKDIFWEEDGHFKPRLRRIHNKGKALPVHIIIPALHPPGRDN